METTTTNLLIVLITILSIIVITFLISLTVLIVMAMRVVKKIKIVADNSEKSVSILLEQLKKRAGLFASARILLTTLKKIRK